VPADLVSGLVGALDLLRSTGVADRRAPLEDLARDLAAAPPPPGALEVTARRDLLRELLAVAIDEAGEEVGVESTRLLRGEGSAAEVRARLGRLGGLLDLLEGVDAGG
jgi:hypothetical protein